MQHNARHITRTATAIIAALLAVTACSSSDSSRSNSTAATSASTGSTTSIRTADTTSAGAASAVLLRPVIQCFAAPSSTGSTEATPATTPVSTSAGDRVTELLAGPDGETCQVGEPGATGAVFVPDADVQMVGDQWGVVISLRSGADGEGIVSELAAHCYDGDDVCPSHRFAVEVDGVIVSAPTVQAPAFSGSLQIVGPQLDEAGAQALAYALNAGVGG